MPECSMSNIIIHVRVMGEQSVVGLWRELSVPFDTTFERLHKALQTAFGWADTHSFEFSFWNVSQHNPEYLYILDDELNSQHQGFDTRGSKWEEQEQRRAIERRPQCTIMNASSTRLWDVLTNKQSDSEQTLSPAVDKAC